MSIEEVTVVPGSPQTLSPEWDELFSKMNLEQKMFIIDAPDVSVEAVKEYNAHTISMLEQVGIKSPEEWIGQSRSVEVDGLDEIIDLSIYPEHIQNTLRGFQDLIRNQDVGQIAETINLRAGRRINPKAVSINGIRDQLDLIQSELDEAYIELDRIALGSSDTPYNRKVIGDFIDAAIGDILLCALGVGSYIPINSLAEYINVCLTNLTRIPRNMEEAVLTVDKMKALGIETVIGNGENADGTRTYPVLTINKAQTDIKGEKYSANKFCKGINVITPIAYGLKYEVNFVE